MKYHKHLFIFLVFLALVGCSEAQSPAFSTSANSPSTNQTLTPSPKFTATSTPSSTITLTLTLSPSPRIFVTATETPQNFVLAETGYDIADVRLSYIREDILLVDFKYRLDESLSSKRASISIDFPQRCQNHYFTPIYLVDGNLIGEGHISFKMNNNGVCSAASLTFIISPSSENPHNIDSLPEYQEYVIQSYTLTRNFPTLDESTIELRNFHFEAKDGWKGIFTFDYKISNEIPIPSEKYQFEIYSSGQNGECFFRSKGSTITEHIGTYTIDIDPTSNFSPRYKDCLEKYNSYTYSTNHISVIDELAGQSVYFPIINYSYKVLKSK